MDEAASQVFFLAGSLLGVFVVLIELIEAERRFKASHVDKQRLVYLDTVLYGVAASVIACLAAAVALGQLPMQWGPLLLGASLGFFVGELFAVSAQRKRLASGIAAGAWRRVTLALMWG
jgi:hypothetical protein